MLGEYDNNACVSVVPFISELSKSQINENTCCLCCYDTSSILLNTSIACAWKAFQSLHLFPCVQFPLKPVAISVERIIVIEIKACARNGNTCAKQFNSMFRATHRFTVFIFHGKKATIQAFHKQCEGERLLERINMQMNLQRNQ